MCKTSDFVGDCEMELTDETKRKILIAAAVVAVILIFFGAIKCCLSGTEKKILELSEQIETLKEDFVPMQFEIVKKKDSEIKVKVVFCDVITGKKVSKAKTYSLYGDELNLDFQVIRLSKKNYVFYPSGLYTDKIPLAESERLHDLYDKNGFPSIYRGLVDPLIEKADRDNLTKELKNYYEIVKSGVETQSKNQYGTAVHDLKTIRQFKKGVVYSVLCHPHTGGIEIVKAD